MQIARLILFTMPFLALPMVAPAQSPQWVAGLHGVSGEAMHLICSGVLVAPAKVLTAAHCVRQADGSDRDTDTLLVSVGGKRRDGMDASLRGISEIRVHPDYRRNHMRHDLALLVLERRVSQSTRPVELAAGGLASVAYGEEADHWPQLVGWGGRTDGQRAGEIRTLALRAMDFHTCIRYWGNLVPAQLCAGKPDPASSICHGDSGGALVHEHDGRTRLFGIASFTNGSCEGKVPGVFASVPESLDWLDRHLGLLELKLEAQRIADHSGEQVTVRARATDLAGERRHHDREIAFYPPAGSRITDAPGKQCSDGYPVRCRLPAASAHEGIELILQVSGMPGILRVTARRLDPLFAGSAEERHLDLETLQTPVNDEKPGPDAVGNTGLLWWLLICMAGLFRLPPQDLQGMIQHHRRRIEMW